MDWRTPWWVRRARTRLERHQVARFRTSSLNGVVSFFALFITFITIQSVLAERRNAVASAILVLSVALLLLVRGRLVVELSPDRLTIKNVFFTYSFKLPVKNILIFSDNQCFVHTREGRTVSALAIDGRNSGRPLPWRLDPEYKLIEVEALIREVCPTCISDERDTGSQ